MEPQAGFDQAQVVEGIRRQIVCSMTLANVVRLNVYTTDVDELFKHWTNIPDRFGGDDTFVTSVLGVTRLAAPGLLVLLEATAVD